MIHIDSVYRDVALDNVNKDENGHLSYDMFNRLSRRAELRMMDWLTGDVAAVVPPQPYLSQKNKDWLSFLIVKKSAQVLDGKLAKPDDYYQFENLFGVEVVTDGCQKARSGPSSPSNRPIELLDGQQYNSRCNSFILSLRPENGKPISKMVGANFEFSPEDIGTVTLEYIRYPKFGELRSRVNPIYNDLEIDPAASVDYEWPESMRDILVWYITDLFSVHNREQALRNANTMTGKTTREAR